MDKVSLQGEIWNARTNSAARTLKAEDATAARRREAAVALEATFVEYMLREMRRAQAKEGLFGAGAEGDFYQSLLESAVAKQIAERERLGLAEMILRQLEQETSEDNRVTDVPKVMPRRPERTTSISEEELQRIIDKAAAANNVDPALVCAVIVHESGGDPRALSSKGAAGLMQLMPETARELGVRNRYDPIENVFGGTRYLAQMLTRFQDNTKLALAAYNAGPAAVERYGDVPPFVETRNYVARVLTTWRSLKQNGF